MEGNVAGRQEGWFARWVGDVLQLLIAPLAVFFQPYEDMAEKDKERYKKEMETYVPPPDTGSDDGKKTKKSSKEAKSSGKAAAAKASTSKLSEEFVKDDSSSGSGSSSSDSDSDSGSDSDSDDSE